MMRDGAYLCIDKLDTEDVGEEEDDFVFGVVDGRGGDVAGNSGDCLEFA